MNKCFNMAVALTDGLNVSVHVFATVTLIVMTLIVTLTVLILHVC